MSGMLVAKIADSNTALLALIIVVFSLYFVTNRPSGRLHVVKGKLDTHIPLVPAFAVPYLLFLPTLVGTILYAYITDTKFEALALSISIVYAISYATYLLYQTHVPRQVITGHDIFSKLVRWTYDHDRPYNGMPSTHASGSTILAAYYLWTSAQWGWLIAFFCLIVVLSTLFVKQHFVLDAVTGVTLGLAVSIPLFIQLAS
jgi:membrane-associated phospholipid phosphatase